MQPPSVLRTRIYVDGYNLYYGCLKGSSDKWLDLLALFEKILASTLLPPPFDKSEVILADVAIKYFTAPILAKAAKAEDSVSSQSRYHSAIVNHLNGRLELIEGYYALDSVSVTAVDQSDVSKPPRECTEKVEVWKLEEKQSDVNLAVHALYDALTEEVDHVVMVTNDTDLVPVAKMIKEKTGVILGLIVPTRDRIRGPNTGLQDYADWCRSYITNDELSESQMPRVVIGKRKPTLKPLSWYENAELLHALVSSSLAKEVLGKEGKIFRWLDTSCPELGGKTPITLLSDQEGLVFVIRLLGSKYKK